MEQVNPEQEFVDTDEKTQDSDDKDYVRKEIDRIRAFVKGLSIDDLKEGDWFVKLITYALGQYTTQVNAEYFKEKYPDLPPDAIVDARIKLASNYSAMGGALTSAVYTGAIAATIGSGGGASPLTLPAGGTSFVVDLVYTSYLQLRMTHDISVLYNVPFDLTDSEDTQKFVKLAFGIKVGETTSQAFMKGTPAVLRPVLKKIFTGSTLTAMKGLPVIGKYLLQRNIIKFAIPGLTIPLTTAVNRWTTLTAGKRAKSMLRRESMIIEAAKRIVTDNPNVPVLASTLWLVSTSEKAISYESRLLLQHVINEAKWRNGTNPQLDDFLAGFRTQIDFDEEELWERLHEINPTQAPKLYKAATIAAAVDGSIKKSELKILKRLADRLNTHHDLSLIEELKEKWK